MIKVEDVMKVSFVVPKFPITLLADQGHPVRPSLSSSFVSNENLLIESA